MIIFSLTAAYLPLMVNLNIAAYGFISSTDKNFIRKRASDLLFIAILCQTNAVLNSVIYLSRSSRIKRYYYKLYICDAAKKIFRRAVFPVQKDQKQWGNKKGDCFAAKIPPGTCRSNLTLIRVDFSHLINQYVICVCVFSTRIDMGKVKLPPTL